MFIYLRRCRARLSYARTRKALHWDRKPAPYRDFPARARANLGKLDPHRTTDNCQPRYEGHWQGAHALALKRPSPVDRASRTCFAIGGLRRECLSRHSPCEIAFIGRLNCMFNRITVVGFDLTQISSSKSRRARPPHSKCMAPHY